MKTLSCVPGLLLITLSDNIAAGQAPLPGTLTIETDIPAVAVARRTAGRNFLSLPPLSYNFSLQARCAPGLSPQTMSLSVADTRKSLASADIAADSITAATLDIPAAQIGPVAVAGFCVAPDEESGATSEAALLEIPSVLSAQVSLLCASETDQQMVYASKSLDVTLECELPAEPGENGEGVPADAN